MTLIAHLLVNSFHFVISPSPPIYPSSYLVFRFLRLCSALPCPVLSLPDTRFFSALVRPIAKAAGKSESRDAILRHYVHLVRQNLHIVLCISPVGTGLRTRCNLFPSLVRESASVFLLLNSIFKKVSCSVTVAFD